MSKAKYQDLSKEELLQILEKKDTELARKYGISWDAEKIPEKVVLDCESNLPVLERVKEKTINSPLSGSLENSFEKGGFEGWQPQVDGVVSAQTDQPTHILIEGDNYHALAVLNYTHKEKIDVIYIDPPYNTGNKDFVYNDKYVDKEDGYRHSKWLNFMEKRLKLAKNLLTDKGVIFISIDDNEQSQLKLLCDLVFGEQNFISQIVWRKKYGIQNDAKFFSTSHEYLLCYAKNILETKINQLPRSEKHDARYKNPDNDPRGVWKAGDLSAGRITEKDIYEIITPSGRKVLPPNGSSWRYSQEKFKILVEDNRIWFGKDGSNVPSVKRFLSEVQQGITPDTFWDYGEVGHTDGSRKALKDIFEGHGVFDYPKPVDLIKRCL